MLSLDKHLSLEMIKSNVHSHLTRNNTSGQCIHQPNLSLYGNCWRHVCINDFYLPSKLISVKTADGHLSANQPETQVEDLF